MKKSNCIMSEKLKWILLFSDNIFFRIFLTEKYLRQFFVFLDKKK